MFARTAFAQLDQDVARIEQDLRAVLDERVASDGGVVAARAGQREHRAAVPVGVVGRDRRAADGLRFDDHAHVAQRRDDPVAHGELRGVGLHPVRVLAHDHAVLADARVQRVVPPRVGDVEAGRNHADDRATRRERAFVRGAVDADREPAHHGHSGVGEVRRDLARIGEAVWRRAACADHRDPWRVERVHRGSFAEQHGRTPRDVVADGVVVVTGDPDVRTALRQPSRDPVRVGVTRPCRSDRLGRDAVAADHARAGTRIDRHERGAPVNRGVRGGGGVATA